MKQKDAVGLTKNRSIDFFNEQFQRQSNEAALKLNPFEEIALPYLSGEVLDFGCGLGNLAFAAAERGCSVTALDASPAAIKHIEARAAIEHAKVVALLADLRNYPVMREYDCIVSIGLLMFFDCETANRVLADLTAHVRPGGIMVLNVLIAGTTFKEMFDDSGHCLFESSDLRSRLSDWQIERMEFGDFDAPGKTIKRFCTIVARKP